MSALRHVGPAASPHQPATAVGADLRPDSLRPGADPRVNAHLQVRPATFPPAGFSTAPAGRAWAAACRPCGTGGVPMLIARSSLLDRPGWRACMAAAHAHIAQHEQGGRL